MKCKYGLPDCVNEETDQCQVCFTYAANYVKRKTKKRYYLKKHHEKFNRTGSKFEQKNQYRNKKMLDTVSSLTPNSGAGNVKGDLQIKGLVNIMEEYKTKVIKQTRGKETFTIKKQWLKKLEKEANAAEMDFWTLKFSFFEDDEKIYSIIDSVLFSNLIANIIELKREKKEKDDFVKLINLEKERAELENTMLRNKIEELKIKNKKIKK